MNRINKTRKENNYFLIPKIIRKSQEESKLDILFFMASQFSANFSSGFSQWCHECAVATLLVCLRARMTWLGGWMATVVNKQDWNGNTCLCFSLNNNKYFLCILLKKICLIIQYLFASLKTNA